MPEKPKKCPRCSSEVIVTKFGIRFGIICLRCRLRYAIEEESEKAAYEAFARGFREGSISVSARDLKELKKEVAGEGFDFDALPQAVKRLLLQGENFPVRYKLFKETEARYGVGRLNLHTKIKKFLRKRGISQLYEFQEKAIELIFKGKNVIIVAPTASGKTEAFALPIVQKILEEKSQGVKALFVYPTKALARDQMKKFKELEAVTGIKFAIYDGDTTQSERRKILSLPPDILITNPDMLHIHLTKHSDFFKLATGIKYLVLDEIHEYTGAFGTNVHFILKRLRRFCDFQIIGASATIGNPKEFAEMLFDTKVEVVEEKQGKKGAVHFLIVYPLGRSDTSLIVEALRTLLNYGYRVLVFANTHKNAEVIGRIALRNKLNVAVHRGGLTKEYRHKAEGAFRAGIVKALVATPTLELGIDIGEVDAVVSMLVNFNRLIQRIGRAGRKGQESIAVLALRSDDPISGYYKNHPEDYFTDIEPAYIEPRNEVVSYYQILAAALDRTLTQGEFAEFENVKEKLLKENLLKKTPRGLSALHSNASKILTGYNIRGVGDTVIIKEGGQRIGERSMPMAARELHPGAIYLHAGRTYRSTDFKFYAKFGVAAVEKFTYEENKTEALRYSIPEIIEIIEEKQIFRVQMLYCKLRITEVVHGYVVKNIFSNKKIEEKALEKPIRYTFETRGFVFTAPMPEIAPAAHSEDAIAGSFHAVEHVLIEGSNMLTGGGAGEIGGVAMGTSGTIFVYDSSPGGNGISKLLYDRFEEAVKRSLKILQECKCTSDDGCPSCTYSYQCGNNNRPLFKKGAIESMKLLIENAKTRVDREEYSREKPYI